MLSPSSLGTATSGTQEKRLPLLPSGPDGIHIRLLRRAAPRLQKDKDIVHEAVTNFTMRPQKFKARFILCATGIREGIYFPLARISCRAFFASAISGLSLRAA